MSETFTCVYGDTLHGKTTFLDSVMRYCLARDPKFKARLYTCSNYEVLVPWVKAGVLEVWQIDTRQEPFDTVIQAAQGWWPDDPSDPTSKVRPSVEGIGAWFFEELSTFCDYMMGGYVRGGLAARAGRNERIGPAEETVSFVDGSSRVGGNPRTHYNIVQRWIHGAVVQSRKLPGHVVWTSHETVAKDERRMDRLILGPELVGTAATAAATRWFGSTIHALRVDRKVSEKDPRIQSEYRLYLKPHFSPEIPTVPYKAALRVPAEAQAEAEKLMPEWIPNDRSAFERLMEIRARIDELSNQRIQQLRNERS
jgi:hypothetical protein